VPGIQILSGYTIRIANNIIDLATGTSNSITIDTTVLSKPIGDVMITDNWCGVQGGGGLSSNIDGIKLVGSPDTIRIYGLTTGGWTGYALNLNGTKILLDGVKSSGNTNGDVNINSSTIDIISPQFGSSVGIASSGGSFCQLAGEITGTVAGTRHCNSY